MKALAIALGFFSGITLASFIVSLHSVLMTTLLAGVFFLAWCVRKKRAYLFALLVLVGAVCGSVRTHVAHDSLAPELARMLNERVVLEGRVVADPDVRETTVRLTLYVETPDYHAKVLVVVPHYPEVRYGETVRVEGILEEPEPFDTDGGRVFRYDQFLAKDGIFALVSPASHEVTKSRGGARDTVLGFFSDLKRQGIDALSRALPEPHASLAGGLILGGKQGLGEELLDEFIVTGLVHIVVLSGYNVMIVAEAVFRMFSLIARRYAALMAGVVITAFVLTAGAGPASIRAGIMAGIALFGRATGRTYDAFRALIVAGILMLIWNPLLLIHDPGFQLSFIATIGLIFGAPIMEQWLKGVRSIFVRDIVASTISAQVAVLPLLLYQNGLFSLVALPANVVVLPLVPLAMILSACAGVFGFLAPSLAPLFGLPAYAVLSLIMRAVEFFASLPFAGIQLPAFPFFVVVLLYGALLVFVMRRVSPGSIR